MKPNVRRHVNAILAAVRTVQGRHVVAFPAFILFDSSQPPPAWLPDLSSFEFGEVFGIYENETGSGARAIIVAHEGLIVLAEDGQPQQSLRYDEVGRWDRLSKEPVSKSLIVWKKSGERVELPFVAREGDAFSFVQFLLAVLRDSGRGQ
jgi:hypothetical protein